MKYVALRPFVDVDLGKVERHEELDLTKRQAARLIVNGFVTPLRGKPKKSEELDGTNNDSD